METGGNRVETSKPLADFIEIRIFSGEKDRETTLCLKREKMTAERACYRVLVDQRSTPAYADPCNKPSIDRIAEDEVQDIYEL